MTPVLLSTNVLIYLALLAIARRGEGSPVSDALLWCWLAATAGVMFYGGQHLPLFIAIDCVTGLYLALRVQTKTARDVAFFFLPMMALNGAAYWESDPPQPWQYTALSALSFAQVSVAIWGAWGGGLIEALDNLSDRFGLPPVSVGINKIKGARR